MNTTHISKISAILGIPSHQVETTAALLEEGATVPFIARYRKEKTGQLDEVQIAAIRDGLERLGDLDRRREAILKSLAERDLLSVGLQKAITAANDLTTLEDIYLPYRPKRRTRAMIAREKGLEPLAMSILNEASQTDPAKEAEGFINTELNVPDAETALAGARDIIAEQINENATARRSIRRIFEEKADVQCSVRKAAKEEGGKYRDYFEWDELARDAAGHRMLAMFRGEKEGVLSLKLSPPESQAIDVLQKQFVKASRPASRQIELAAEDAYKRLTSPSIEAEYRMQIREKCDAEAIGVFAANLRELMMAAPLGQKATLALDPGYRSGCKTVCLDTQGKLLINTVVHITSGEGKAKLAVDVIVGLCEKFNIEAIAIGNGTASRETEAFVKALPISDTIRVVMVNESGASVYSASHVARDEFPDEDITVRGAVSIGRRLMDPLSELVKMDPKAIGVGQYQHDVDQAKLKKSLDDVVVSCVNHVGVELNTASKQLLSYVSGLGPALAGNIVEHRDQNGPFKSRDQLKKVPRLGSRAFEQAAGFLRIRDAKNPLDGSAVHPERYTLVDRIATDLGCTVPDLMADEGLRKQVNLEAYVTEDVGMPTLQDIMQELAKPGRDPRDSFEAFSFDETVHSIDDVKVGMKLPGIITNVTRFGAFVDIGAHQDGLVHISELADHFVNDPADVVKVNQKVNVTVQEVDLERSRIALSMKSRPGTDTTKDSKGAPPRSPRKAQAFTNNPFGDL